jgi:hypothetical protein
MKGTNLLSNAIRGGIGRDLHQCSSRYAIDSFPNAAEEEGVLFLPLVVIPGPTNPLHYLII